jgi:serine/threonine protein phosphatase PrpC
MRLRMLGATDKGLVRSSNQDAYFCSAEYGIAIVSDGMGGHKGGELASQLVVTGLKDAFLAAESILMDRVGDFLDDALKRINADILKRSSEDEACRGMGATVNYLQFAGGSVAIGHAGDSRTYLVRSWKRPDGKVRFGLWCLTVDHNVGVFIERGLLTPGKDLPPGPVSERTKARLMRGMGVVSDLRADLYCKDLDDGDVYLTCSDGLHGYVSDKEILKTIVTGSLAQAPERLVKLAHSVGAPDNVTIVLSAISDVDEPFQTQPTRLFAKTPFLLRLPSGELRGLMSCDEIIDQWLKGDVPLQSEVSNSLGKWVFLSNRDDLFRTYPEFSQQRVRDHFHFVQPESNAGPVKAKAAPASRAVKVTSRKSRQRAAIVLSLFAVLLVCGLWSLYTTLQKVLLPAY